uniref:Uncharacterized protein n=1 Tax=Octopus bimaculoides TaxID=37653 RepID=A0A0L8HGP2_OCTBM
MPCLISSSKEQEGKTNVFFDMFDIISCVGCLIPVAFCLIQQFLRYGNLA